MRLEPLELKVPPLALTAGAATVTVRVAYAVECTPVDPLHPEHSARLVTAGVYGWTRNPTYPGFVLFLFGLAITLHSLVRFALTALTAVFLHRLQIKPVEQSSSRRSGITNRRRRPRCRQ